MHPPAVDRLVPFVHVADVNDSIRFYALLGFSARHAIPSIDGRTRWAFLVAGKAELMVAGAGEPIVPEQQAILLYMYCRDVAALRGKLLAAGVSNGGAFGRGPLPTGRQGVLFDITHPGHMPDGELRVHDPDGYCILIGQLEEPCP